MDRNWLAGQSPSAGLEDLEAGKREEAGHHDSRHRDEALGYRPLNRVDRAPEFADVRINTADPPLDLIDPPFDLIKPYSAGTTVS